MYIQEVYSLKMKFRFCSKTKYLTVSFKDEKVNACIFNT